MSITTTAGLGGLAGQSLRDWFVRTRVRSKALFDLLTPDAYYSRPIALRHPIVFYEGHLPAFGVNTIVKRALGRSGIDQELDVLFARGIDPDDEADAARRTVSGWPSRERVRVYADAADAAILDALDREDLDRPGVGGRAFREAIYTVIEHEAMHQETLLYMWHRLPFFQKIRPAGARPIVDGPGPDARAIPIPGGVATLGANPGEIPFGWDNEFPCLEVHVPAFDIDRHDVTNAQFLEFVEAGGYHDSSLWSAEDWAWRDAQGVEHPLFWERRDDTWHWRGMFELVPLPPYWPVYVSQAEAAAYARWKGKRLPTEAEFHRAAYGDPSGAARPQPWGDAPADQTRGNFDFAQWDPVPVGSFPEGRSAWGVDDLAGNGWEWTASIFEGFPGFQPTPLYPEYSADFFDGKHYVIKGASPATARELVRRSFRNWFRGNYPYVYATFRCAR